MIASNQEFLSKADDVSLDFYLCDTSCMYSWLFENMEADEADELLQILEGQISKKYGKYLKVEIVKTLYKDIESVVINPRGQLQLQKDKWKILSKALKELSK